jgi:hypothetical protein
MNPLPKVGSKGVRFMSRKSRKNPTSIDRAWNGKPANYVSPRGNYSEVGYSELAMHTRAAGKKVVRFALFHDRREGKSVRWAQVELENGTIIDGLTHEVLPPAVLTILGRGDYARTKLPAKKQKLQLWALSKGVAANPGKRGSCHCLFWHAVTPEERKKAKEMLDYARKVGDSTGAMMTLQSLAGKCKTSVAQYSPKGGSKGVRFMSRKSRKNSGEGFTVKGPEGIAAYRMLALKGMLQMELAGMRRSRGPSAFSVIKAEFGLKGSKQSVLDQFKKMCAAVVEHREKPPGFNPRSQANGRRVHKNPGRDHPIWQTGNAVHSFMSKLDNRHLPWWRDVSVAGVLYGSIAAKRAHAASAGTVRDRMEDLVTKLQSIKNLRAYKTLLQTPLRAVAGAWGLMEMMRSDF